MEISLSNYYGLFYNTYKNVLSALEIDEDDAIFNSDKVSYLSERTLIIFKLDFLLFKYKQENDPHRLILKGKSALVSYLVNNKKISFSDAKVITLADALTLLSDELRELKIPEEAMEHLQKGDFNFHDYDFVKLVYHYSGYHNSEWDPELWDKRLLK